MADLCLPMFDLVLSLQLLLADQFIEDVADAVHLLFTAQVESDVSCIPSRPNQRDHGYSDGIEPALVSNEKLVEKMGIFASRGKILAKRRDAGSELALCLLEGLKERFVRGVLKPAQAALFVHRHCEDVGGGSNVAIGVLNVANRLLCVADLPDEGSRDE